LPSGRKIKVVKTPSLMVTEGRDARDEVTKVIGELSPGPHAFIIVLQAGRTTEDEKRFIIGFKKLFGDENFLKHTIIVVTRKADIIDENEDPIDIHSYMDRWADPYIKQLYEQCGRRIVAVENKHSSAVERTEYAREVIDEVIKMGGIYSHDYFKLLAEKEIKEEEIIKLRREVERIAKEQERNFCSIL